MGELGDVPKLLDPAGLAMPTGMPREVGREVSGMTALCLRKGRTTGLPFSGLVVKWNFVGDVIFSLLSCRGERGTFHRLASSGSSSSRSSYSFSSSFAVFRFGAHEPLLTGADFSGGFTACQSGARLMVALLGSIGGNGGADGEGDRDRL